MANSPFTSEVMAADQQKRQRRMAQKPILRDGPKPETFTMIERFWDKNLGHNDGYHIYTGDVWREFRGAQPLIDQFFDANPLKQGERAETRRVRLVIDWGHDNERRKIVTAIREDKPVTQPATPPLLPPAPATSAEPVAMNWDGSPVKPQPDKSERDAAFPRDDDGQPVDEGTALADYFDEKAAETPLKKLADKARKPAANDWINNDEQRSIFWAKIGKLEKDFGWQHKDVEALVYKTAGCEHLHDYLGTANDLFKAVNKAMLPVEPPSEKVEPKTGNNVAEDTPPAIPTALPVTNAASAPILSVEKPIVESPVKAKPIITLVETAAPEILLPTTASAIIPFNPTQAVVRAKMYSDVVSRMYADKVLIAGHHYGVVPGTDKPTLFKAGAECLCSAFGFCPEFHIFDKVVSWDPIAPMFYFQYECRLINIESGKAVATGIGSCNSMESKYRWRKAERKCPTCGKNAIIKGKAEYGGGYVCFKKKGGCDVTFKDDDKRITDQPDGQVPNDDIFSLVNTIDKMSQKRALVAATLIGANASDYFTQDLESLPDFGYIDAEIA